MTILFSKSTAAKEKISLLFLLKLLILGTLLKTIFFIYNFKIAEGWEIYNFRDAIKIFKWSVLYDLFCISIILVPLLTILFAGGKYVQNKFTRIFLTTVFSIVLTIFIFL